MKWLIAILLFYVGIMLLGEVDWVLILAGGLLIVLAWIIGSFIVTFFVETSHHDQ